MKLYNGVDIPAVGFGVFKCKDGEEAVNSVKWALEAGYGHIDTACIYKNEASVGQAIKESSVAREDIFLTTKLWNEDIRQRRTREAFEESLEKLEVDYVDLYLIHWPVDGFQEAWKVMEELYQEGKVKAIGVSNFHKHHLDELNKVATIKPMVNQIESNLAFNNEALIKLCQEDGMIVESWSPLGGTGTTMLSDETLIAIGEKHHKSPAQVIIRWNIQNNVVVLPKSVNQKRIIENLDVFDFELSKEDMEVLSSMNKDTRTGPDPDDFNF